MVAVDVTAAGGVDAALRHLLVQGGDAFLGRGGPGLLGLRSESRGQITLGLRGGLEIELGLPVDLQLKIAIARGILPLLALPAHGGPDYLDVTVPERPVAGRNPQPSG